MQACFLKKAYRVHRWYKYRSGCTHQWSSTCILKVKVVLLHLRLRVYVKFKVNDWNLHGRCLWNSKLNRQIPYFFFHLLVVKEKNALYLESMTKKCSMKYIQNHRSCKLINTSKLIVNRFFLMLMNSKSIDRNWRIIIKKFFYRILNKNNQIIKIGFIV